jgi:hypothetical protein
LTLSRNWDILSITVEHSARLANKEKIMLPRNYFSKRTPEQIEKARIFEAKQAEYSARAKAESEEQRRLMDLEKSQNDQYPLSLLDDVPAEINATEYDYYCQKFNVEKFDNVDCYGVKFLHITAPEYSHKKVIEFELGRRHLKHLNNQQLNTEKTVLMNCEAGAIASNVTEPDYPNGKKLGCGCTIYYKAHELSAIGSTCTDCYDKMSD